MATKQTKTKLEAPLLKMVNEAPVEHTNNPYEKNYLINDTIQNAQINMKFTIDIENLFTFGKITIIDSGEVFEHDFRIDMGG